MPKKQIILSLLCFLTATISLRAQSTDDVLRYSLEYPSYDPVSLVMPGVSQATGFGAYQENPAVMSLFEESYLSFDLSSRFIDETGTYLGNHSDFTDNQTSIGDLGFVYRVPTVQGSLVLGAGYSQTTDFNRALAGSGFNSESTITDFYSSLPHSDALNTAAYNAFAIEDVNPDSSVSILRFGTDFSAYPGIRQDFEITEKGRLGEYSAFLATEFLKHVSIGASVGYLHGSYSYRREFLETDRQNHFNGQIIDADGDEEFTDIDRILNIDTIEADIQAFNARLGMVFHPSENFHLGVSYEFPSRLYIDENYNTEIVTTFDNGNQTEPQEAPGKFSYNIVRPQRLKAGITIKSLSGLALSASAEGIRYSEATIEFDELDYNPLENDINAAVKSNFEDVVNLRGGLEYNINDRFTPRIGYGFYPSPQKDAESDRQLFSGGFSAEITEGLIFDLGLQYSIWEDQNRLYHYNNPAGETINETVREDVTRIHVMAGIKMAL